MISEKSVLFLNHLIKSGISELLANQIWKLHLMSSMLTTENIWCENFKVFKQIFIIHIKFKTKWNFESISSFYIVDVEFYSSANWENISTVFAINSLEIYAYYPNKDNKHTHNFQYSLKLWFETDNEKTFFNANIFWIYKKTET